MFDYSLLHWTTFLSAAVLLNLSPGPDIAFILGKTAQGGPRTGFAAMFGIWTGAFGHVLMAAVGLSALLVASATAFTAVKWIGAAYLIWLGVQALRSGGGRFISEGDGSPLPSLGAVFRQGILIAVLNPKVAVFFLAFLPQFVVADAGPVPAQLFLHGVLIIAVAGLIEPPLVLLAHRLMAGLKRNPGFGKWMDRTLGALLVALGVKLALSRGFE
jgi:threonine/homoserine/homoserine lactone efflux protein